ncbi:MAG: hypothetical protein HRT71_20115 [Flavobacteriales bacterium]|nr:hypothetical protein [Flavobacteriales bacterium]
MEYHDELYKELEAESDQMTMAGQFCALINIKLGRMDEAFAILEEGIECRAAGLIFMKDDPFWVELSEDKRYEALLAKITGDITISENTKKERYAKSGLKSADADRFLEQIEKHMQTEKPYLENDLGLKSLADQGSLTINQLSQVLNEKLEQNFYNLVNGYRLE